jgi:hypothetical protein
MTNTTCFDNFLKVIYIGKVSLPQVPATATIWESLLIGKGSVQFTSLYLLSVKQLIF